jgi:hypothetical protein
MRTTSLLKIFLTISMIVFTVFICCEEDSPTDAIEGEASIKIEAPEPGKLNVFPILGYMQSGAKLAPEIDGVENDLIWDSAEPLEIQLDADDKGFAPKVTLRALYDNWFIYILAEWEDNTQDITPNFWWYGNPDPNGTTDIAVYDTIYTVWVTADSFYKPQRRPVKIATGPEVWSRWDKEFNFITKTTTYEAQVTVSVDSVFTTTWDSTFVTYDTLHFSGSEDGMSFMWNTNIGNFLNCSNLCHGGETFYADLNEAADVWSWYAYRTNFKEKSDDLSLTNLGFVGDQGDSAFVDNINSDENLPARAFIDHPYRNTDVLYDTATVNYYSSLAWFSGNYIPGYELQDPTDSRADVETIGTHTDGKWILEIKRKLQTRPVNLSTDNSDIQFNPDSDADVDFHLVVYNNARGKNHAYTSTVQVLHFVQLVD